MRTTWRSLAEGEIAYSSGLHLTKNTGFAMTQKELFLGDRAFQRDKQFSQMRDWCEFKEIATVGEVRDGKLKAIIRGRQLLEVARYSGNSD